MLRGPAGLVAAVLLVERRRQHRAVHRRTASGRSRGSPSSSRIPTGVVPTPAPILEERLTFSTAFDPAPGKIATGAVVAVAGHRRPRVAASARAVTAASSGPRPTRPSATSRVRRRRCRCEVALSGPVEFEPPDGIRPGQLGTLIDEQANLLDVTATIIDLAVRGFILIQEVPGEDGKHKPDYRLTDLGKSRAELRPYEVMLLDSLFETGSVVELSDLKYKFSAKLTKLRNALYDDAIDKGWFSRRPDHVRLLWRGHRPRRARRRRVPHLRRARSVGDSPRSRSRSSVCSW